MSGLGSGMPKSVTLVTQVTVNFWAHVTGGTMKGVNPMSVQGKVRPICHPPPGMQLSCDGIVSHYPETPSPGMDASIVYLIVKKRNITMKLTMHFHCAAALGGWLVRCWRFG